MKPIRLRIDRCARQAVFAPRAATCSLVLLLSLLAVGNAWASACNGGCDFARDVAIDRSGRIVFAGCCEGPTGGFGWADLALWRLNDDGTPDTTFGDGGVVHV